MTMPPSLRKRGRPRGAGLTVIGLPKRQKRDGPVKFLTKLPMERELGTVLETDYKMHLCTDVLYIL